MNSKSLTSTLVIAGVMLGGFGTAQVASAQTDDDTVEDNSVTVQDENETETDATEESDSDESRSERGERDGEGRRGRGHGGCNQEAVAEAIGISVDELSAAREDGASLAEIAEANGVDPQVVADALIAGLDEKLDAKVADGSITEDEAAERLTKKSERIEDRILGDSDTDDSDTDDSDTDEGDTDEGEAATS